MGPINTQVPARQGDSVSDLKHCYICDRWLSRDPQYFHRDRSKHDGFHGRCKDCKRLYKRGWQNRNQIKNAVYQRRWRDRNPAKWTLCQQRFRARKNGVQLFLQQLTEEIGPSTPRREINSIYLYGYKVRNRCVRCGENRPECLTFHHRDPLEKEFRLSDCGSVPFNEVLAEIDKCDLVCANCHMSLHYWQRAV